MLRMWSVSIVFSALVWEYVTMTGHKASHSNGQILLSNGHNYSLQAKEGRGLFNLLPGLRLRSDCSREWIVGSGFGGSRVRLVRYSEWALWCGRRGGWRWMDLLSNCYTINRWCFVENLPILSNRLGSVRTKSDRKVFLPEKKTHKSIC